MYIVMQLNPEMFSGLFEEAIAYGGCKCFKNGVPTLEFWNFNSKTAPKVRYL